MNKRTTLLAVVLFLITTLPAFANPRMVRRVSAVPNEYIVVLDKAVPQQAVDGLSRSLAAAYNGSVKQIWTNSIPAFHFIGSEPAALGMLEDPRVAYIEQNATSYPYREAQLARPDFGSLATVANATTSHWHLDRLDDPGPATDGTYNMTTEGRSVYAYVIDTGVWTGHSEFEGRVIATLDFSDDKGTTGLWNNDQTNACGSGQWAKENAWHGTAVASLISGRTVGAARPYIVSLKVARCEDLGIDTTALFRAIDFIAASQWNPWIALPGVINHSGYVVPADSNFSVIRDVVRATVANTGFPYFTSADNWAGDACQFSPNLDAYTAANPWGRVFVVGGTTPPEQWNWPFLDDFRWQLYENGVAGTGPNQGSNTGSCISLFAPAANITAARHAASTSSFGVDSGTSFSAPLAAAIAARYIEKQLVTTGVRPSVSSVYGFLRANAVTSVQEKGFTPYSICIAWSPESDTFATQPPKEQGNCTSANYTLVHMNPTPTSGKMLYYQE